MEIGMVGLGRMGGNMAHRLHDAGHEVAGYDARPETAREFEACLTRVASSLELLVDGLKAARVVWLMVPAGEPTDDVIANLLTHMSAGDILIDGGNSHFRDSIRHAEESSRTGVRFLDIGVSGGIWGLREGYCLMAGGDIEAFRQVEPILKALAQTQGYAHVGPAGAGHYSKMVHNGIEYAMMQAYGEGFEVLKASSFDFDLQQLSDLWMHGSVVRSWLLELAARSFGEDPDLSRIKGYVEDSGEGRWTIHEALEMGVPVPAMADSLFARFRSRQSESFSAKVIASLRHQFGGHAVVREDDGADGVA